MLRVSTNTDFIADVQFLPISGLIGMNMKTRIERNICPWWNGPCLFEALDAIEGPPRDPKGPFRYNELSKASMTSSLPLHDFALTVDNQMKQNSLNA